MTPERWQIIDRLLDEVSELPQTGRERFLAEKCGADADLYNDIRSLLEAREKSEDFIESAAIRVVAKNVAVRRKVTSSASFVGETFGSYKIEKLIGEGGMSDVYLAFDEKLKRKVAVKLLPGERCAFDERICRLELEASVISALNHPNIVTIYDVGVYKNTNFIATEFVNGETLREFVGSGMTLEAALNVAVQCCDALEAAHSAGIIHRDIKPENIIVRPDGYIKILDFGLAQITDDTSVRSTNATETENGLIIGTPAYMSPEQVYGRRLDPRTDLWSMGLVLYELLTGKNPFRKEAQQHTFAAILTNPPPTASSFNSEIPLELDLILTKALEKDSPSRYQTAGELKADLMRLKRGLETHEPQKIRPKALSFPKDRDRYLIYFGLAGFFILTILAGLAGRYFYYREQPDVEIDWTKAKSVQLTGQTGSEIFPHLAPDGEAFVFAAKEGDDFDVFLQKIGEKKAINLTENSPDDDTQPVFSPDGKLIAFRSERLGGGIFVIKVSGENPRRVTDFGFHPFWSPDGEQLAFAEKQYLRPMTKDPSALWIVELKNGEKRKLIDNFANQPSWSPNGERIAFWFSRSGGRRDVATVSAAGGEIVPVTSSANTNWNPVWSPDGKYLYFTSDRNGNMAFWRVRIDQSTGEVLSEAEIVPTPAKFSSHLSFSSDGRRMLYAQTDNQSNIKTVEFDEKTEKILGQPISLTRGDYEIRMPRLSPNGEQFVMSLARSTQDDIVSINREGENWRDLTKDEFFDRYPRWSPDGKQIAFASDRSGIYEIWMIDADGANLRQITKNRRLGTSFPIWSPDGKGLTYHIGIETYILDLTQDLAGQTPKKLPLFEDLKYLVWDWSPDGKKLAGNWGDYQGNAGIGFVSLETNEYVKITGDKGEFPLWLSDSRRLIWAHEGEIYIADSDSGKKRKLLSLPGENISSVGISPDKRLLYFTVFSQESNLWLLDLTKN